MPIEWNVFKLCLIHLGLIKYQPNVVRRIVGDNKRLVRAAKEIEMTEDGVHT